MNHSSTKEKRSFALSESDSKCRITYKIRRQAKKAKIKNAHQLSMKTRLTYSSVRDLWNNNCNGVNILTLATLAYHLKCEISDLYQIKWNN